MAAKKSDLPTPTELADTLTACAGALTAACGTLADRGDQRGVRALQAVEPALRRAAEALTANGPAVADALDRAGSGAEKD